MPLKRKTEAIWIDSQNRWQIKVQVNGRRKTFYSFAPGKKGKIEAERKADKWLDDGASDDPKLETIWDEFLEEIKKTTSTGNYMNHESMGRMWLLQPKLKIKRISAITIQDWQDVINLMHEKGKSRKYMMDARGSMTVLYNYVRKRRLPMERPEFLTIPNSAPVGERSILQPDKLKLLFQNDWIEHYGKRKKCFFIHAWRFWVLTGLGRGELCGLKNEDIQDNIMFIQRSVNKLQQETTGKTKNARRYIILSDRMLSVLADHRRLLKSNRIISPWVFPDEHGDRLDSNHLYKKWATYRRQHDMGCSLHELRHPNVKFATKKDFPIQTVPA